MDIFTAKPERVLGNLALASLVAGAPVGLVLSLLGGFLYAKEETPHAWIAGVAEGLLLGPTLVMIGGLAFIAPLLLALRHFGLGGPFFVYAASVAVSLVALADGFNAGLVCLALSLTASYVFSLHAYANSQA